MAGLVSIVIANHNYGRFVGSAIESALAQEHGDVEVVVVDDGSTDESRSIIRGYGSRITPILKPNGGQASAFNAGLPATRGDVVILLDADDVLLPTAAAAAAEAIGGAVKVHWPLYEVRSDGTRTGALVPSRQLSEGDLRDQVIRDGPYGYVWSPTSGNAWSREYLEEVGPIPEDDFRNASDGYLLPLAALAGRIARVTEPQACYRIHGENEEGGRSAYEKNLHHVAIYDRQCEAMARFLARSGHPCDIERWRSGSHHFRWRRRLLRASEHIAELVGDGEEFILLDDDVWEHRWGRSEVMPGRFAVPYPPLDSGPPADGPAAVRELERVRESGGRRLLLIAWSSRPWLESYPELRAHLRTNYLCVLDDESATAFDLTRHPEDGRATDAPGRRGRPGPSRPPGPR